MPLPWWVRMKSLMKAGRLARSASLTPLVTWLMMMRALSRQEISLCGFTPDWFSVKKTGSSFFPMS